MRARAMLKMLRSGDVVTRLAAARDGQAATRVAIGGAALETGILDLLGKTRLSTERLMSQAGFTDRELLEGFLRVLAARRLVRERAGSWELARRGRALLQDDAARATYEAFSGYHQELYRDLPHQLRGGPPRRDIVDRGDVIARLSMMLEPFVHSALDELVREIGPARVLDVGCGSGLQLAAMLDAAPAAHGVGVESDPAAADLARQTLERRELVSRSTVLEADLRGVVVGDGAIGGPVDLALLANVVYYLPLAERVPLFGAIAGLLRPGGALLVVTTALTDGLFSRHFDLLLRAQEGQMELLDVDVLLGQLREAGLSPEWPRRIAPGEPLTAVVARA